jgi:hypothetical protein
VSALPHHRCTNHTNEAGSALLCVGADSNRPMISSGPVVCWPQHGYVDSKKRMPDRFPTRP